MGYLAFALVSTLLAVYWALPVLHPEWDLGGIWSDLGNGLFFALCGVLLWGFLLPSFKALRPRIRGQPRRIGLFAALGSAGTLVWLIATGSLEPAAAGPGPVLQAAVVPVLSPFGLWPSVIFLVGSPGLEGYLSPAMLAVSALSGVFWASITLERLSHAGTVVAPGCSVRGPQTSMVWIGVGGGLPFTAFAGACCAAPPLALTALASAFPGVVVLGLLDPSGVAIPGVLYLAFLSALMALERRTTRPSERHTT